jgi:hypothetical protein
MLQENRHYKREAKEWNSSGRGGHCPFIGDPFADCFIASINSQNIDQAIYYCGKHFEECEIYRSVTKRERM